jgi:Zn/Cd-binding protein ZinT
MTTKEEFFKGIQVRKEALEDETIYWNHIYSLIKDYSHDQYLNFKRRYEAGEEVTEQELEVYKAYCIFENINY